MDNNIEKLKQELEDGLKAIFLCYPTKFIGYKCYITAPKAVVDKYNLYIRLLKIIDSQCAIKYNFIVKENDYETSKDKTH